jgi:hypothetical protein
VIKKSEERFLALLKTRLFPQFGGNRMGRRCPSLPCRAFLPVNGEKEAAAPAALLLATFAIGEIGGGSQMRGSADTDSR